MKNQELENRIVDSLLNENQQVVLPSLRFRIENNLFLFSDEVFEDENSLSSFLEKEKEKGYELADMKFIADFLQLVVVNKVSGSFFRCESFVLDFDDIEILNKENAVKLSSLLAAEAAEIAAKAAAAAEIISQTRENFITVFGTDFQKKCQKHFPEQKISIAKDYAKQLLEAEGFVVTNTTDFSDCYHSHYGQDVFEQTIDAVIKLKSIFKNVKLTSTRIGQKSCYIGFYADFPEIGEEGVKVQICIF